MRPSISSAAVIFLITSIFLTACQGDRSATESVPIVVEEPTQGSTVPTEILEEPASVSATTAVIESPPEVLPTPRQGLEATDPSMVLLASGRPTLVEFFAFW